MPGAVGCRRPWIFIVVFDVQDATAKLVQQTEGAMIVAEIVGVRAQEAYAVKRLRLGRVTGNNEELSGSNDCAGGKGVADIAGKPEDAEVFGDQAGIPELDKFQIVGAAPGAGWVVHEFAEDESGTTSAGSKWLKGQRQVGR